MGDFARFMESPTQVGDNFFRAFNHEGALTSVPEGSFDLSSVTTVGTGFFEDFNRDGRLTHLPDSFKRPALGSAGVDLTANFLNAFNSPDYAIKRSVPLVVAGIATPSTNKATFSDNQPDRCLVHDNRLVNPCILTITDLISTPPTPTSGEVMLALTVTGGSETYTYSFDNGTTRQS